MIRSSLKPKKCKACGNVFTPARALQKACSIPCAELLGKAVSKRKADKAAREERKSFKAALEKVKTRGEHLAELQAAFNAWIRLRDAHAPCISCDRSPSWNGQWDAGHYRSRGSEPTLRFEPDNVHKQCLPCNRHLSGNLIAYRVNLAKKIGPERVEWLEGKHPPMKYTVAQILELKAFYRAEVRRLKKEAA